MGERLKPRWWSVNQLVPGGVWESLAGSACCWELHSAGSLGRVAVVASEFGLEARIQAWAG